MTQTLTPLKFLRLRRKLAAANTVRAANSARAWNLGPDAKTPNRRPFLRSLAAGFVDGAALDVLGQLALAPRCRAEAGTVRDFNTESVGRNLNAGDP